MRYSFHGKVRATGQQVDGFVEANTSTEAIDRLADQGIIGVYTVRPEAKRPKNAIVLSGEDWADDEEEAPAPALPIPVAPAPVAPAPVAAPVARVVPNATDAAADGSVLQKLVDQIQVLSAQVEKLLARPAQVVYQSGPARGGGGGQKKSSRIFDDAQNSTLRDIFQNNLDLRKSLEKLGAPTGPTAPKSAEAAPREMPKVSREAGSNGSANGRDHSLKAAQPAA